MSYDNKNPLSYRYDTSAAHLYTINVLSNNELIATRIGGEATAIPSYLGALLTEDREVIWVNHSQPLP